MVYKVKRQGLLRITEGKGYGLLMIVHTPGDVLFAISPVPELIGYEFVFVNGLYDIWKDNHITSGGMSLSEVRLFIRTRTPVWLYDETEPTKEQLELVREWVEAVAKKYRIAR